MKYWNIISWDSYKYKQNKLKQISIEVNDGVNSYIELPTILKTRHYKGFRYAQGLDKGALLCEGLWTRVWSAEALPC